MVALASGQIQPLISRILQKSYALLLFLYGKAFIMIRFLVIVITILSCQQHGFAQHIKRRGTLGVGFYQKLPDSLQQQLQYKQGAVIQFTQPGTTAPGLGITANDILTRINNIPILQPNDIFTAAKSLREGDHVEVSLIRNKKPLTLKGNVAGRPRETSATADVVYGEFAYKNGYVRTIYKTLKGKKPLGTIYFLQGLPCYSMDNFKEGDMTKQALDAMVDRGFAVYRMEKADMGDNVNMPPCETMGFNEELEMYIAGYKNLLTLKEVDTSRIFLFGHSMGGLTAPLLAEKYQPLGVVVYGTVFKPWMDYLLDAFLIQSQYFGEDLAILRDNLEKIKPYIYDYFYGNKTEAQVTETPDGIAALSAITGYDAATGLAASGRALLCHKELNQHNMARAWKNTKGYVLAIYGECDIAANNANDHLALISYVNKIHPGKGTFWQAAGTTHLFEEIGSMEEFIKWQSNPAAFAQFAATRFNAKVFDYACNWMRSVLDRT